MNTGTFSLGYYLPIIFAVISLVLAVAASVISRRRARNGSINNRFLDFYAANGSDDEKLVDSIDVQKRKDLERIVKELSEIAVMEHNVVIRIKLLKSANLVNMELQAKTPSKMKLRKAFSLLDGLKKTAEIMHAMMSLMQCIDWLEENNA